MNMSEYRRQVASLRKIFHRGILTEQEYHEQRLRLTFDCPQANRYYEKFVNTKMHDRYRQRCEMAHLGASIIDAVMGCNTNCLIIVYTLGNIFLYWDGRVGVVQNKEEMEKHSICIDALAANASVHSYSRVLDFI